VLKDRIQPWLAARDIVLTDVQYTQLAAYQRTVLTANEKMNLTGITSDEDFAVKHFIDSLSLLPFLPTANKPGALSLLDIGTGAGFPGVPLKIARPDIQLTLVDALRKRVFFLREALSELNISAECRHARAEDMPRLFPNVQYDIVTARAVAHLKKLCAYALPLVKTGGIFLAMKGPDITRELNETAPILEKYKGTIHSINPIEITSSMIHTIIAITK